MSRNHAEGIIVSTALVAGAGDSGYESQQHAKGLVVPTTLTAGGGNGGLSTNHGEALIR